MVAFKDSWPSGRFPGDDLDGQKLLRLRRVELNQPFTKRLCYHQKQAFVNFKLIRGADYSSVSSVSCCSITSETGSGSYTGRAGFLMGTGTAV